MFDTKCIAFSQPDLLCIRISFGYGGSKLGSWIGDERDDESMEAVVVSWSVDIPVAEDT